MAANLDIHCQMLLDEYRDSIASFEKIKEIVLAQLNQCVAHHNLSVSAIEARIKTEESLIGKLELKGQKYHVLSDITDIVGARIITFYTDEVDKISTLVSSIFEIDWQNSIDKRKVLELDQFGYMSLHYICRIPKTLYEDKAHPEINEYRFEVQMRTALQHVWATMYHDTGYKSGIEVPKDHLRNLNRIAGMLELADEQFSRIRMEITDYRRQVQALVSDGNFDQVPLDGDTFRSYLALNPLKHLIEKIASINQAEVYEDSFLRYLIILPKIGIKTLGDLDRLIKEYSDEAYQLALHQFSGTDLDIFARSVALQNLCIIYIVRHGGGAIGLKYFYDSLFGPTDHNPYRAERTLEQVNKIKKL